VVRDARDVWSGRVAWRRSSQRALGARHDGLQSRCVGGDRRHLFGLSHVDVAACRRYRVESCDVAFVQCGVQVLVMNDVCVVCVTMCGNGDCLRRALSLNSSVVCFIIVKYILLRLTTCMATPQTRLAHQRFGCRRCWCQSLVSCQIMLGNVFNGLFVLFVCF
jgi:hypothetical protein